ncbi:hypothetical protein [Bradyrhizobium sp. RDI18]|uniref:hypothetical protein n=1 Tax=Bradyrhizobium sp. RDI18 TaxID=3367400 RepID=UPI00371FDF33
MTICKKLSLGMVAATMLATPAMAQMVYQEPGYSYPNSAYVTGGYGVRTTTPPGYYYGNRFHPAPRVGAFASQPWTDGSYYGYVEREY